MTTRQSSRPGGGSSGYGAAEILRWATDRACSRRYKSTQLDGVAAWRESTPTPTAGIRSAPSSRRTRPVVPRDLSRRRLPSARAQGPRRLVSADLCAHSPPSSGAARRAGASQGADLAAHDSIACGIPTCPYCCGLGIAPAMGQRSASGWIELSGRGSSQRKRRRLSRYRLYGWSRDFEVRTQSL